MITTPWRKNLDATLQWSNGRPLAERPRRPSVVPASEPFAVRAKKHIAIIREQTPKTPYTLWRHWPYLSFNWSSVPGAGCTMNCNDDISRYPKNTIRRHTSTRNRRTNTLRRLRKRSRPTFRTSTRITSGWRNESNVARNHDKRTRTHAHAHRQYTRLMVEIWYCHFWWWKDVWGTIVRWGGDGEDTDNNHADSSWSPMVTNNKRYRYIALWYYVLSISRQNVFYTVVTYLSDVADRWIEWLIPH